MWNDHLLWYALDLRILLTHLMPKRRGIFVRNGLTGHIGGLITILKDHSGY